MASLIDLRSGKTTTIATMFTVSDLIGEGRFAEVYKAFNKMAKIDVALKIYRSYDQQTSKIAEQESKILDKLKELNTGYFPVPKGLRKFRLGNNNHPFLAMELCEYQCDEQNVKQVSLEEVLVTEPAPSTPSCIAYDFWDKPNLFQFILSLSEALWMLHKLDIIHRDIKPSNILLKKKYSEKVAQPFFIDFNTSLQSGIQSSLGGTNSYLPPEVIIDTKRNPHKLDDLWAIARIIAEIIYGKDRNITDKVKPHKYISFDISESLSSIIKKALSLSPEKRFQSAEEFHRELEKCLFIDTVQPNTGKEGIGENSYVNSDKVIWARENELRIRRDILTLMSGEDEIPLFKEIKNNVGFLFSTLTSENTQSFELKAEVIRLGTDAIPSIIEESYKLIPGTYEFEEIARAVGELALQDQELAIKAINQFCMSSDYSVRRLCQEVCKLIKFFPIILIGNITGNVDLFMSDERIDIADMCILYSDDDQVLLPLNQYMCREYLNDERNYLNLKKRIATRISELNFKQKALLIVEDTHMRIWDIFADYNEKSPELKRTFDIGISQLFADAYASLGQEALDVAISGKLPEFCEKRIVPIKKLFISKLAMQYPGARKWIFKEIGIQPERALYYAAKNLPNHTDEEKGVLAESEIKLNIRQADVIDCRTLYNKYLAEANPSDSYELMTKYPSETIVFIENTMNSNNEPMVIKNILKLLKNYHNRQRSNVLGIIINNWDDFTNIDHELTFHILEKDTISNIGQLETITELLGKEVNIISRARKARKSFQKIIEQNNN